MRRPGAIAGKGGAKPRQPATATKADQDRGGAKPGRKGAGAHPQPRHDTAATEKREGRAAAHGRAGQGRKNNPRSDTAFGRRGARTHGHGTTRAGSPTARGTGAEQAPDSPRRMGRASGAGRGRAGAAEGGAAAHGRAGQGRAPVP